MEELLHIIFLFYLACDLYTPGGFSARDPCTVTAASETIASGAFARLSEARRLPRCSRHI